MEKLICPHCGIEIENEKAYELNIWDRAHAEENFNYQCQACDNKVYVNAYWKPVYETFKTEHELLYG